jgi:ubiquinone/menaquinone biosynthesis C-methylase UbiE
MSEHDKNHWLDEQCAQAFWDQRLALPYQELLRDTSRWLDVQPGERWLDLGCGGGQLTALLWRQSGGQVGEVVALDCNPLNAQAIDKLRRHLDPPCGEQIRFIAGNFSDGLPQLDTAMFDGIVSGLAISYAESRDPHTGRYTDHAYNHLLAEMYRVLKPGGRVVFSVNVPHVQFWPIVWKSLRRAPRLSKPGRTLLNIIKMQLVGRWLQREARRGRFHYLPLKEIERRLLRLGFDDIQACRSYAEQAYVIAARKEAAALRQTG